MILSKKNEELLIRIDERTENIQKNMVAMKKSFDEHIEWAEKNYVQRTEFLPVKAITYGLVGTVMTMVIGLVFELIR